MEFIESLNQDLENWFLLKHPFYQSWGEGGLTLEILGVYAKEYYHHVAAFPRYISQIHALCDDIGDRQVLLENLVDEERGEENHPELWKRFAEGISGSREMEQAPQLEKTKELVDGFFDLTKEDYHTGLGAIYAYERQTPAVSRSKIDGLKCHYGINEPRTLQFFEVHEEVDKWHTEEVAGLIKKVDPSDHQRVRNGAVKGAQLLWGFLDGMSEANESRIN